MAASDESGAQAFAVGAMAKLRRLASELGRERRALDREMGEVKAARSVRATT